MQIDIVYKDIFHNHQINFTRYSKITFNFPNNENFSYSCNYSYNTNNVELFPIIQELDNFEHEILYLNSVQASMESYFKQRTSTYARKIFISTCGGTGGAIFDISLKRRFTFPNRVYPKYS